MKLTNEQAGLIVAAVIVLGLVAAAIGNVYVTLAVILIGAVVIVLAVRNRWRRAA